MAGQRTGSPGALDADRDLQDFTQLVAFQIGWRSRGGLVFCCYRVHEDRFLLCWAMVSRDTYLWSQRRGCAFSFFPEGVKELRTSSAWVWLLGCSLSLSGHFFILRFDFTLCAGEWVLPAGFGKLGLLVRGPGP